MKRLCEALWCLALALHFAGCAGVHVPPRPTLPAVSLEDTRRAFTVAGELLEQGEGACAAAPDRATCQAAAGELRALVEQATRLVDVAEACERSSDVACALSAGVELVALVPRVGAATEAVRALRGAP